MSGHSPLYADNGHFHHRLLEAGFPVRLIFLLYFLVSGICAAIGVVAYHVHAPEWVLFFGFIALFAIWLLFIRSSPTVAGWLPRRLRRDLGKVSV